MVTLDANLFDGRSPLYHSVRLQKHEATLRILRDEQALDYPLATLRLEPGMGDQPDVIRLPDGGLLACYQPGLCSWLPLSRWQRLQLAAQQRWRVLLPMLLLAAAMLYLIWQILLPVALQPVAKLISPQQEERWLLWLVQQTISSGEGDYAQKVNEEHDTQLTHLQKIVDKAKPVGSPYQYTVRIFWQEDAGANAMAMVAGRVFVTEEFLQAGLSDDEVFAIIAHEVGHIEHRHVVNSLLQTSSLILLQGLLTGDVTLAGSIAGSQLLLPSHSRAHEREADAFAYAVLKRHGLSPCLLGQAIRRLRDYELAKLPDDRARAISETMQYGSIFDSHPLDEERSRPDGKQCSAYQ